MIPTVSEVPSTAPTKPASPLQFNPPPSATPRIPALDIIRGVAILAALFVSIWIFGGFTENDQAGLLLRSKGWNYRVFGTVDLLLNGKMRALIAIVFGAGMILYLSKTREDGETSNADYFIRRQMWLIAFGIFNAILLLWTGDLLFHLGVMGILLFPFIRMTKKGLIICAATALLIFCGKHYWNYADDKKKYKKYLAVVALEKKITADSLAKAKTDSLARLQPSANTTVAKDSSSLPAKKDTLTKKQQNEKGAWEGLVAGMKYDPKKDEATQKAMRRISYGSLWNHLLPSSQSREAQWTYKIGVWELAAMILWGMALLKLGFFNARLSGMQYFGMALAGISIGLLLGWWRLHNQQHTLQDYAKYLDHHLLPYNLFFPFEIAFVATGYTSLILFFCRAGKSSGAGTMLAAVGKLALSNYLLQSIIGTLFFTGLGMGYFGRLTQFQLYVFAAEVCLLQIGFSLLWLRRYQMGPAEWLLRCLVYKRWLPNRMEKNASASPPIASQS